MVKQENTKNVELDYLYKEVDSAPKHAFTAQSLRRSWFTQNTVSDTSALWHAQIEQVPMVLTIPRKMSR